MAVADYNTPSLAPSYQGIQDALNKRANLELNRPQNLDIATTGVKRVDQELTALRQYQKDLQSKGLKIVTPEMANQIAEESGLNPERLKPFHGLAVKPDDMEKIVTQWKLQDDEDVAFEELAKSLPPDQQPALKTKDGREAFVKNMFATNKATGRIKISDPTSTTGLRWATQFSDGKITPTEFEAPQDAVGSQGKVVSTDKFGNPVIVDKNTGSSRPVEDIGAGASGLTRVEKQDIRPIINDLHENRSLATQAKSQLNAAKLIEKKLNLNNPASVREIQTQLALLSGENGRLTEQDVANQGASRALIDKLGQTYEEMSTGKITKKNIGFVKELVEISKKSRAQNLNQQFQGAFNAARDYVAPIETYEQFLKLERIVGRDIPDMLKDSGVYRIRVKSPDGKVGSIDRSKLKKAFDEGWRLAEE